MRVLKPPKWRTFPGLLPGDVVTAELSPLAFDERVYDVFLNGRYVGQVERLTRMWERMPAGLRYVTARGRTTWRISGGLYWCDFETLTEAAHALADADRKDAK